MKKLLSRLFSAIFFITSIQANTLNITNLTSGQISIALQTNTKTISQTIPANMNPILNDVNEPDPNPTVMTFDNNIKKITITRFNPNTPQIIYYDGQNTNDSNQKVGGIKALNLTARQSNMLVWNDYVEINNVAYSINNFDSFIFKANKLKKSLSPTNIDIVKKEIDDISTSLDLVQKSDMGSKLSIQIISIQSLIDEITNNIKIIKTLNSNLQEIKSLQNNLALGNNNLIGTNKPYQPSDDSIQRAQKKLNSLQNALKNINQLNPTGLIGNQVLLVEKAMNNLQNAIKNMQYSQKSVNYEELIPTPHNLQTVQSISY